MTVLLFIVIIMVSIMLGFVYGIITAAAVAIIYTAYSKKSIKEA